MEPEIVVDYQCEIGEGVLWHPVEKRVYWADIPAGRLFRYDPATGSHEQFYEGASMGGFTLQEDGSLLLFMEKGAVATLRDGKLELLITGLPGEESNRFNDVIADPAGRVFCGTTPLDESVTDERRGTLYRLDTDGTTTPVLSGVKESNGLGFSPDRKRMYFTDTYSLEIYEFDYDVETGEISNQRLFVRTADDSSYPDGMTVDAEGHVWSARWDGSAVYRYAPSGAEEMRIDIPVKKVSSVSFGGPDYGDMYISTAGGDDRPREGEGAGALFRVRGGVRGAPENLSRVGLQRI